MKIKLDNRTHWRDDHIRAFISRCMKDEREDLCKRGAPPLKAVIVYTRNGGRGSSGYAYYHSNYIKVRLPKNPEGGVPDKVDFAHVITHELAHTRGVHHRAMLCGTYRRIGEYKTLYAWANDLPLEVKPKRSKQRPGPDLKMSHAERMLRAAMTREKRAVTIRKKWQGKVRYYQNQLAKAAMSIAS